ncbi:MAG TPA: hypothetical protein VEX17_01810 [Bacillales bacterium]|nr:hypothetical protein [Bacillales bacterium]
MDLGDIVDSPIQKGNNYRMACAISNEFEDDFLNSYKNYNSFSKS